VVALDGHEHCPFTHVAPLGHACPHAPQWLVSVFVFLQPASGQ
jgi:hypothetical protein